MIDSIQLLMHWCQCVLFLFDLRWMLNNTLNFHSKPSTRLFFNVQMDFIKRLFFFVCNKILIRFYLKISTFLQFEHTQMEHYFFCDYQHILFFSISLSLTCVHLFFQPPNSNFTSKTHISMFSLGSFSFQSVRLLVFFQLFDIIYHSIRCDF